MNNNELYHYGRLGQKWGVRRYQNPDGTLTNAGRRKNRKQNKPYIDKAKKSLKIAEKDYNQKKAAIDETNIKRKQWQDKFKRTKFSEEEDFEMLTQIERGQEITNKKFKKLMAAGEKISNEYDVRDKEFRIAESNYLNVKSFIKGLSGEPLDYIDFSRGEEGRKYVDMLIHDPKYRYVFFDDKQNK